uniref:Uncharacterized protein n=1 Tax=Arundo donax TaxID=35708 RepID=A0A0A9FUQ4_ARUDO
MYLKTFIYCTLALCNCKIVTLYTLKLLRNGLGLRLIGIGMTSSEKS